MLVKWYGHSCFLFTGENGVRVLTDPCDTSTGYTLHDIEADVVTSSHDHHDHNYFEAAKGSPVIVNQTGETVAAGIRFYGVPTWHDNAGGKERGRNLIFLFELDGLRIAHLGDLGHIPDEDTLKLLEGTDIMLVPIGGVYTIDHKDALKIRSLVKPRVMIPMHYATPNLTFALNSLQQLIDDADCGKIHRVRENEVTFTKDSLGNNRIVVMEYER